MTARILVARAGVADTPFYRSLASPIPRPPRVIEAEVIVPPRLITIGWQLNRYTGKRMGRMRLPLPAMDQECGVVITGASGTGKSVLVARIIHEMVANRYHRSALIIDAKTQYHKMQYPNENEAHLEKLSEMGEKPQGIKRVESFVPAHLAKRWDDWKFIEKNYHANKVLNVRAKDLSAGGMLAMGNKAAAERTYIKILENALITLGHDVTVDKLKNTLSAMRFQLGKKRSVDVLLDMLDNLVALDLIDDDGVNPISLFDRPHKRRRGRLSIINTTISPPNDVSTVGLLANLFNGMCFELKKHPDIQPVVVIEEGQEYFSKWADPALLEALSNLHFVIGRTCRVFRIFCYQMIGQVPDWLANREGTPIRIHMRKNLELWSGGQKFGVGLGEIEIRNIGFMPDRRFYFECCPPPCAIGD